MSKKIMKRSLALGALMAFVITGSAMAAEVIIGHNGNTFKYTVNNGAELEANDLSTLKEKLNADKLIVGNFLTSTDSFTNNEITIDTKNASIGDTGNGQTDRIQAIVGAYGTDDNIDYKGNIVNVKSISDTYPVNIFGAYGEGNVLNNTVNIIGGDINALERTIGAGTSTGSNKVVSGNVLNILGGNITNGSVRIEGGCDNSGNNINRIKNNIVNISGGNLNVSKISGGYCGRIVENNSINITGGIIEADIIGGHSSSEVMNNTVNIGGNANIANSSLYGYAGGARSVYGNTLNINDGWTGTVKSIQNFNAINIKEAEWNTTKAVVTVNNTLKLASDTTVDVGTVRVAGDDETFVPNAAMTLISADQIDGTIANEGEASAAIYKGVATIYDATIEQDGNAIKLQLAGEESAAHNPEMNPQVLVIGESRAAATAFTNQGSELIETGLDALARDKATDTKSFAAVYGNASEFATGSEVKVNGWSGIVGVGKTNADGLTMGAFFENGEGNYRTYNDVNGEFMRGDGDACYNGGGFLVRKDNKNGVYTEASLRAGNLQNELRNAVRGSEGLTGYDIDTFYYGAHVGIGKIIPRGTEGDNIDVYGKFIYTHHDSEDFTIDGDKFNFDSVDSERVRLGFRINEVQTNKLSMYYGAAWEYEFGGDADNTVVGYDLSTPSLGGSTVIAEVGMHYNASEKWSFDINARAYGGQRDGFSGSVQANYMF